MRIDAGMWPFLNDKEKQSCLRGENLYNEIARNGNPSLIKERVQTLSDDDIYCLLIFSVNSDLDLEKDSIAYEIVDDCLKVQMERHPLEIDKKAAYNRFKKMMADEFGCTLNGV